MAVTAKFLADFDSFFAAVQKADVELKGMETGAGNVERSLNRMADSFSGRKIIQDATLAAEAIERLGGATKLTEAEQVRINGAMDQAIQKYEALGQSAPAAILALKQATDGAAESIKKSTTEVGNFEELVGRLTERFAIYEVLHAALDFSKELLHDIAALDDLSKATGINTDGLQRLSYIGKEFGVDTETMARAVEELSSKLANGDKSATSAVQMLGLSVDTLLKSGPQEAFLQIAESVGRVEDPMRKAGVAAELFGGRLSKELLPLLGELRQKMEDVPKDAIISDETIKSAHEFEVQLEQLEIRFKSWVVTSVTWVKQHAVLGAALASGESLTNAYAAAFDNFNVKVQQNAAAMAGVAAPALTNAQLLQNKLTALRDEAIAPLDATQRQNILTLKSYGESLSDIAKDVGSNEVAVKLFLDAHKAAEEQLKKNAEAIKKLNAEVDSLADRMHAALGVTEEFLNAISGLSRGAAKDFELIVGSKVIDEVADLEAAFKHLNEQAFPPTAEQLQKVADMAGKLAKEGGVLTPALMDVTVAFGGLDPKMIPVSKMIEEIGTKVKLTVPEVVKYKNGLIELAKTFGELGSALRDISPLLAETFADFGKMTTEIDNAQKSFANASKAFKAGDTLTGIEGIASGIAGIAAAAVSAGKAVAALWNHFFGTAGRDAVTDFVQSFGGFDALHAKLGTLGADGEKLWIALTQGVGRNNPAQAKQVIDQINAAFEKQQSDIQNIQDQIDALGGNGTPSLETMKQAADALGISTDSLGHAFEEAQAKADWQTVIDSLDTLQRGGANLNDLLGDKGLQKKLSDLVEQSKKFGTDIPSNMKATLETLADMGVLVDANGLKLSRADVDGLHFGEDLQTTLGHLNDTLKKLIDTISGKGTNSLSGALETIGRTTVEPHIKPIIDVPDIPGWYDYSGAPGAATGAFVGRHGLMPLGFGAGGMVPDGSNLIDFRPRGTDTVPALVSPGEIILNAAQQRKIADALAGRSGDTYNIAIYALDGASVQRTVESREFIESLARAAKRNIYGLGTELREVAAA